MRFEHRPFADHAGLGIAQTPARAEHRNYTDVVVNALLQHAAGTLTLSPLGLAVLEAAAGALSRALALATVQPANGRTAALTPSTRGRIGRDLLRHGQSVHVIHIGRDGLELVPAHAVDVSGQPFGEWRYKVDISAPDGTRTMDLPASSVLHVRLASDATSPWSGVPPLAWAVTSASLGTALETRLGQEADQPTGSLIVAPRDPGPPAGEAEDEDTDPYSGIKRDLAGLRGELAFVESMNSDPRGEGGPRHDWAPTRIGADPPGHTASAARRRRDLPCRRTRLSGCTPVAEQRRHSSARGFQEVAPRHAATRRRAGL